jgi:hypothetical protein
MIMHLPIVVLASLPLTPVADDVPKFDIARECQSEGGSDATQKKCADNDPHARDQLRPLWTQFSAGDKTSCLRETSTDGTPSYVELLTCLELARDVKKSAK